MKKVILPMVAVAILFCGCFFEDNSKKSYNENIVDVSSDALLKILLKILITGKQVDILA